MKEPDIAAWFLEDINKNRSSRDKKTQQNLLSGNTTSVIVGGR